MVDMLNRYAKNVEEKKGSITDDEVSLSGLPTYNNSYHPLFSLPLSSLLPLRVMIEDGCLQVCPAQCGYSQSSYQVESCDTAGS